ncbi:hypothetical protein SCLCIDRAFT_34178 [Scleroderma citrinum Foug A]|uniref:Uncharacterized protein n=1 Tax=Scleroderma citrinum Foug A TaxID=1036808 RepID=A0A0C3D2C8_9AGAM|nr:hypothetical protein SCLCIDRAFT_34178 [Scleroderma citrinum Foug A]
MEKLLAAWQPQVLEYIIACHHPTEKIIAMKRPSLKASCSQPPKSKAQSSAKVKGKKCAVSSSEPESTDGEDEQHTKHSSKSNCRQLKHAQLDVLDAEVVEVGILEEGPQPFLTIRKNP